MREEPELAERLRDRFATIDDFDGKARVKSDLDEALTKSFSTRDALDDAESADQDDGRASDAVISAAETWWARLEGGRRILRRDEMEWDQVDHV